MGNALVAFAVAEECLPIEGIPLRPAVTEATIDRVRSNVWEPPPEPREWEWDRNAEAFRAHTEAVRLSLEAFLNERLEELDSMCRTGRWVMARARVRVVELEAVP